MDQVGIEVVAVGTAAFSRAMQTAQRDLDSFNQTTSKISQNVATKIGGMLNNVGGNLQQLGRAMTIQLTTPIALLGGSLAKAGIEIEQSFAGISKTVGGVAVGFNEIQQMAQEKLGIVVTNMDEAKAAAKRMGVSFGDLTALGEDVRKQMSALALEIPLPATELNKFAEIAGQFGISADSIAEFTKSIAYLDVATDVAGEDAAAAILQIKNITGNTEEASIYANKFGSALVDLGNNSIATESQILELTKRIAAAGDLAHISDQEMLAWATTIADVGSKTEAGGTAISRVFDNMVLAVAGGGEELQQFADVMGISTDQVVKMFKEDASSAVKLFLKNLKPAVESGKVGSKVLTDLGIGGVRAADNLLRLSEATEIFDTNLARSNKAWEQGVALEEEAIKKNGTLVSQIQILKNTFGNLGDQLVQLFKTDLEKLIETVKKVINWFANLDDGTKRTIAIIAGIAAAIGPVLVVFATLISAAGTVFTAIGGIAPVLLGVLGPVGLVIAAFAGLAAIFAGKDILTSLKILGQTIIDQVVSKVQMIIDIAKKIGQGFVEGFAPFLEDKGPQFERIMGNIQTIIGNFRETLDKVKTSIEKTFGFDINGTSIGQFLGNVAGQGFEIILNFFEKFTEFLANLPAQNGTIFTIIGRLAPILLSTLGPIGLVAAAFAGLVVIFGDENILNSLKILGQTIIDQVVDKVQMIIDTAKEIGQGFVEGFAPFLEDKGPQFERIMGNIQTIIDNIREALGKVQTAIGNAFSFDIDGTSIGRFLGELAGQGFESILDFFEKFTGFLADITTQEGAVKLLKDVKDAILTIVSSIKDFASSKLETITTFFSDLKSEATNIFDSGPLGAFKDLLVTIANIKMDQFQRMLDNVKLAFTGFTEAIAPFIEAQAPKFEQILANLQTAWQNMEPLFVSLGNLFTALDELKLTIFGDVDWEGVGGALGYLAGISLDGLVTGLTLLTEGLGYFINFITLVVDGITTLVGYFTQFTDSIKNADTIVTDTTTNIQQSISNFLTTLLGDKRFEELQDTFKKLGEIIVVISGTVQSFLAGYLAGWRQTMDNIISSFNTTWQAITESEAFKVFVGTIIGGIQSFVTTVSSIFEGLVSIASKIFDYFYTLIISKIRMFVDGFIFWVNWLYNLIVGHSLIPDLINGIIKWFNYLKDMGTWYINLFVNGVRSAFGGIQNVINDVKYAFDLLLWKIGNVVNDAKWYLDQFGSKVQDVLHLITGSPELIIQHPFEGFEGYLQGANFNVNLLNADQIQALNEILVQKIPSMFNSMGTQVNAILNALRNTVSSSFENMANQITLSWNKVNNSTKTFTVNFSSALSSLGSLITKFGSDLSKLFTFLANGITQLNMFVSKFQQFGNGYKVFDLWAGKAISSFNQVINSINAVKYAFDLLLWKISNTVDLASYKLSLLAQQMQAVQNSITGSPELKIQHPFETFENYLKQTDFNHLIETSMSMQGLNNLATPAPANNVTSNETSIDRSVTANISGVPMDTASDIVSILQRQVRIGEALQQ